MSGNSTRAVRKRQAFKPGRVPNTPGFSPIWHSSGTWMIRVGRGKSRKTIYLGRHTDKAEAKFREVVSNLRAGQRPDFTQPTLADLVVKFLQAKEYALEDGDIVQHVYNHYRLASVKLLEQIDRNTLLTDITPEKLRPLRSHLIADMAPSSAEKMLRFTRSILKFAYDSQLVASPIRIGDALKSPSKRTFAKHAEKRGDIHLTPKQINQLLESCDHRWSAMVLLGYFCSMGPADLCDLQCDEIELGESDGWLETRRVKTSIVRRAHLPPILVKHLRAYLNERPEPLASRGADFVILNRERKPMSSGGFAKNARDKFDSVGLESPLAFYALRRSFATYSDELLDFRAQALVLGHSQSGEGHSLGRSDISGRYVRSISDDRLIAISEHLAAKLEMPENE